MKLVDRETLKSVIFNESFDFSNRDIDKWKKKDLVRFLAAVVDSMVGREAKALQAKVLRGFGVKSNFLRPDFMRDLTNDLLDAVREDVREETAKIIDVFTKEELERDLYDG